MRGNFAICYYILLNLFHLKFVTFELSVVRVEYIFGTQSNSLQDFMEVPNTNFLLVPFVVSHSHTRSFDVHDLNSL